MTTFLLNALQGSESRRTRKRSRQPTSKMARSVLLPRLTHQLTQRRKKSAKNGLSVSAYVPACLLVALTDHIPLSDESLIYLL